MKRMPGFTADLALSGPPHAKGKWPFVEAEKTLQDQRIALGALVRAEGTIVRNA